MVAWREAWMDKLMDHGGIEEGMDGFMDKLVNRWMDDGWMVRRWMGEWMDDGGMVSFSDPLWSGLETLQVSELLDAPEPLNHGNLQTTASLTASRREPG